MRDQEKGFTLVEVVTALFVLGVILAVGLPILMEVREQQHLQVQRMQAVLLLERMTESLQADPVSLPRKGSMQEEVEGIRYRINWEQKRAGPRLAGTHVEVEWKDRRNQVHQLQLRALQIIP